MPTPFKQVYLNATGFRLPGKPVFSNSIETGIAPISRFSRRIKPYLISANEISTRHYAFDLHGDCSQSQANMAASAIDHCIDSTDISLDKVSLLSVATAVADASTVSFANRIQNEMGAQGMQTFFTQGGDVAGVNAIEVAAMALELGAHEHAVAVAADMPSRQFNRRRLPASYRRGEGEGDADQTDAHYLRWLLSDGAAAFLLSRIPQAQSQSQAGLCIKLNWIHQKSFAGDFALSPLANKPTEADLVIRDGDTSETSQAAAALALRTSARLIPHLIAICIDEYRQLVENGWLAPEQVRHFLCHYSSEKFTSMIATGFAKVRLNLPHHAWFKDFTSGTNTAGNTGTATIYMMMRNLIEKKKLHAGEQILCLVPDLANMSAAFMLFEVATMPE